MSDNRRQFVRHAYETEIGVDTGSNFYTGLTQDLSAGGLFIATHQILPLGTTLRVKFGVPDIKRTFDIEASVCWVKKFRDDAPDQTPGMGVRFMNMEDEAEAALSNYIATRETLFYDDDDDF